MLAEALRAAGLGALQGLTEFLPVSSSGHLALAEAALGLDAPEWIAFDVAVHVATLAAVVVAFRKEIREVLTTNRRLIPMLVAGSVPAGVVGILLGDEIKALRGMPLAIAAGFALTAVLLVAGERAAGRFARKHGEAFAGTGRPLEAVGFADALVVGLLQAVAIVPGVSRSGSTISAGMLRGVDRRAAVAFSFLLSVPAILGAAVLEARQIGGFAAGSAWPLAAGFLAAFVTGLVALKLLVIAVERAKLRYFAAYCAMMAVATVAVWVFM
jgi:undecaprenyl-diphosphatase